jgi:hypothetical protein
VRGADFQAIIATDGTVQEFQTLQTYPTPNLERVPVGALVRVEYLGRDKFAVKSWPWKDCPK